MALDTQEAGAVSVGRGLLPGYKLYDGAKLLGPVFIFLTTDLYTIYLIGCLLLRK
jgi:hypothetical protein